MTPMTTLTFTFRLPPSNRVRATLFFPTDQPPARVLDRFLSVEHVPRHLHRSLHALLHAMLQEGGHPEMPVLSPSALASALSSAAADDSASAGRRRLRGERQGASSSRPLGGTGLDSGLGTGVPAARGGALRARPHYSTAVQDGGDSSGGGGDGDSGGYAGGLDQFMASYEHLVRYHPYETGIGALVHLEHSYASRTCSLTTTLPPRLTRPTCTMHSPPTLVPSSYSSLQTAVRRVTSRAR